MHPSRSTDALRDADEDVVARCDGAVREELQARARRVAERRGGAAPLRELHMVGVTADAAERAVRARRWTRVAPGWYVPYPSPLHPLALACAGVAYARAQAVVTGLVVLHELGLRWLPPVAAVDLLVPDDVRRRSTDLVRLRRCSAWADLGGWERAGLRLADLDRAVVDAARATETLRDVRGIVLGAVADGKATVPALRAVLDVGQRNGSALTRRALLDAERGCASPPEAELVDALIGRGEPFLVNPHLWVGGVLLGSPDVWLVARNVGGEVESREWHEGAEREESTYDRHERFATRGVPLVHLGVSRVRRSPLAAATYLLERGASLGGPAPPGLVVVPRGPVLR